MPISKKTIEYRKINGLCPRCGQPNVDGKSLCQKHLDQFAAKALKYRHIKIGKGLCPECGGPNKENQYCCDICKEKNKPKIHKSYIKRYNARKTNNKCTNCGEEIEPNRSQCKTCLTKARITRNNKYQRLHDSGLCVICGKTKIGNKISCEECIQKRSEWYKNSNMRIKNKIKLAEESKKVFDHYGNRCAYCGTEDVDVLSIDHINDDGYEHRKRVGGGSKFYKYIIESNFPKDLQILCMNCQWKKYRQTLKQKSTEEVRIIGVGVPTQEEKQDEILDNAL